MKTIAIVNQKGGSGKTASAWALTQAAAHGGLKVLAVDLDPQGQLTFFLDGDSTLTGAAELIKGAPAADVVQTTPAGIDLIGASWDLFTANAATDGSATHLKAGLQALAGRYDLIIIDTPPTIGALQLSALQAASDVVIPLQADVGGLQGVHQTAATIQQVKAAGNRRLKVAGLIVTRYEGRSTLKRQMLDRIKAEGEKLGFPLLAVIRQAVALEEAQTLKQPLYQYAPNSKPAQDYAQLLLKLLQG